MYFYFDAYEVKWNIGNYSCFSLWTVIKTRQLQIQRADFEIHYWKVGFFMSYGLEMQSVGYENFIQWVMSTRYGAKYVIKLLTTSKSQLLYIVH